VTEADLLAVNKTPGQVTAAGLRANVAVALRYFHAWLGGTGTAAIFDLMEDAATAEIARCQVWQWIHHAIPLADGGPVPADLVRSIVDEELAALRAQRPAAEQDRIGLAASVFDQHALTRRPAAVLHHHRVRQPPRLCRAVMASPSATRGHSSYD
jgi:malate synthase